MSNESSPEPIVIEGTIDEVLDQLEAAGFWEEEK